MGLLYGILALICIGVFMLIFRGETREGIPYGFNIGYIWKYLTRGKKWIKKTSFT